MARSGLACSSPVNGVGSGSPNLGKRAALNQMPHLLYSRGTNPVTGQTVDIYENPSEHYEAAPASNEGPATGMMKPLYYMENDFNGPMLKVGFGEEKEN